MSSGVSANIPALHMSEAAGNSRFGQGLSEIEGIEDEEARYENDADAGTGRQPGGKLPPCEAA